MRRPLICGNWKMFGSLAQTEQLVDALRAALDDVTTADIGLAPPFPFLSLAKSRLNGSPMRLVAQNGHWEEQGAFTGEVSPTMLKEVGVEWVILGHSERRQHFGETDTGVRMRTVGALRTGLTPIVCVGETLTQREDGHTLDVIERQLRAALEGLSDDFLKQVVIAYEPVWAIGTGKVATPDQAQEVHAEIRGWLTHIAGEEIAQATRILYGGSVKGDNAAVLLAEPDIDGALVGGASLKADEFARIVRALPKT